MDAAMARSEQWRVTAFDADGESIGVVESPLGVHHKQEGSLDSKPWLFAFDVGDAGNAIGSILMEPIGSAGAGPVAFNNFATRSTSNELMNPDTPTTQVATVSAPERSFWGMMSSFGLISFVSYRRANAVRSKA
jgi:hypothetical protein